MSLPDDYDARKALPIFDGVVCYFPDAMAAIADVSIKGNAQHNPGEDLHWARGKSMDQRNTVVRHMIDHQCGGGPNLSLEGAPDGSWRLKRYDTDGSRHLAKAAWRLLAWLQLDIEAEQRELAAGAHGAGISHVDADDVVIIEEGREAAAEIAAAAEEPRFFVVGDKVYHATWGICEVIVVDQGDPYQTYRLKVPDGNHRWVLNTMIKGRAE